MVHNCYDMPRFGARLSRAVPCSRTLAALGLLCLLLGPSAQAMSLRELRALEKTEKQGRTYTDYYLVGVMEGVLEAHHHTVRQGAKPRICPNGRRLEPRMARGLFDGELRRNPDLYEADMPVELVMRNALEAGYPC